MSVCVCVCVCWNVCVYVCAHARESRCLRACEHMCVTSFVAMFTSLNYFSITGRICGGVQNQDANFWFRVWGLGFQAKVPGFRYAVYDLKLKI